MIPHFKMKGKILRSSNIPANQNPAVVKERVCVCVCVLTRHPAGWPVSEMDT